MGVDWYLLELEKELKSLNFKERQDIIRDFRKYFLSGHQEGKTDIEMITSLGTPAYIAMELLKVYTEEDMVV